MPQTQSNKAHIQAALGFTLAELLIALLIIGEIATFTIPKIINGQQNSRNNAIAHEVAGTIASAYQLYSFQNSISSSTSSAALTPYMNYVKIDTATSFDSIPGYATEDCSSGRICLVLHNGAILMTRSNETFAGTNTTNGLWFMLDPDGVANSNVKSVNFFLTYPGRITSCGQGTVHSSWAAPYACGSTNQDPSWFSW